MKHYGPTERKTVYIPHLGRADQILNLREQPYPAIKLALLEDTSGALHSRGYSANLRDPDPDHSTTHTLTLSKDDHTITVRFQHTLEDDGKRFTITAEVTLGPRTQLDYAPSADQADRRTMRWGDGCPWDSRLKPESVRLKAAVWSLTVDLHLEFAGTGVYFIRIDVRSDTGEPESASSAAGAGARGIVANLLSRPLSFLDIALWG